MHLSLLWALAFISGICGPIALASPQTLIRLVPATFPDATYEEETIDASPQVITEVIRAEELIHPGRAVGLTQLIPAAPLSVARFVQAAPLVEAVPSHSRTVTRVVQTALPASGTVAKVTEENQAATDPNPQYNFGYSVSDSLTGDNKAREESRDGDLVTGSYTVADPDGRLRKVTYTADAVNGFRAKVTYDGQEGPVAVPQNPSPALLTTASVASVDQVPAIIAARDQIQVSTKKLAPKQTLIRRITTTPEVLRLAPGQHFSSSSPYGLRTFNGPVLIQTLA